MGCRARFFVYFTLLIACVLFPIAAIAQTGNSAATAQTGNSAATALTGNSTEDKAFLAIIRAREEKLVFVTELNQIKSYHDKLKSGLVALFSSLAVSSREAHFKIINDEIGRLKQFEDDLRSASDNGKRNELAKQFGEGGPYPVTLNNVPLPAPSSPIQFASRERLVQSGVFQYAVEGRQFVDGYQNVLQILESFNNSARAPLLERLPRKFSDLAGASSDTLTDSQITSALSKYRDVLNQTLENLPTSLQSDIDAFKSRVNASVEALDGDLKKKIQERNEQMTELEATIPLNGRSLYGNKVGAESFNYLLFVFLLVFLVIMIMPKYYPAPVAQNVLKSDFLLQFSTVFVLVAAIIILSIGNFIERNQLPVLLAGISGYVLGQLGTASGRTVAPGTAPPA